MNLSANIDSPSTPEMPKPPSQLDYNNTVVRRSHDTWTATLRLHSMRLHARGVWSNSGLTMRSSRSSQLRSLAAQTHKVACNKTTGSHNSQTVQSCHIE